MADQRRYERDEFRHDERMEHRKDWSYGHGRSWPGPRDDRDWPERSHYGYSRGRPGNYGEAMGGRGNTLGELGFGGDDRSPGYAGEDRIREDVCDRLTDDGGIDASDIEVSVSGTEVTLGGIVPSRHQRRRAEICAERVSGVSHVQNNMRVKEPDDGSFTTAGMT